MVAGRSSAMTLHVLRDLPVRNKVNFSRMHMGGRPLVSRGSRRQEEGALPRLGVLIGGLVSGCMINQLQSPPLYHPTYDTSPAQTIANEPWSFGLVHHHRQQHHLLHPQAPAEEEGDQVREGGTSLPGGSIQTAPIQPASSSASIAEAKSVPAFCPPRRRWWAWRVEGRRRRAAGGASGRRARW